MSPHSGRAARPCGTRDLHLQGTTPSPHGINTTLPGEMGAQMRRSSLDVICTLKNMGLRHGTESALTFITDYPS